MMELTGVSKDFRGVRALDAVDLELKPGELLGLIGPNGSGKTTLLGVASGVLRPTAGRVSVDGSEVAGKGPTRIAHFGVGRTFQHVRLFEEMSVGETVALGAIAKGLSASEVEDVLEMLELQQYSERNASTLAYGLQRKVEIARALAGRPRYLLLDEPAAGMNDSETRDLLTTMLEVSEKFACGILVVDHDLSLIMGLCQRVQVLNQGRTLAVGTPEEIRASRAVIDAYIGRQENEETENPRV